MKKSLKVLSSALLLGLSVTGVVTLSGCESKEEKQQQIDQAKVEAVLEYAKSSASANLDAYVAKTLSALGYKEADVEGLTAKVTEVKGQITSATDKGDVENKLSAGINGVYDLISAKVKADNDAQKGQIDDLTGKVDDLTGDVELKSHIISAIKEVYSECGEFYPNTKDDGRIEELLSGAAETISAAETIEAVDAAVNDTKKKAEEIHLSLLEASSIKIATADELIAFIRGQYVENKLSQNVMLTADIDLTGKTIECLDSNTYVYSGVFNGNGHTIKNYAIHNETAKTGLLFGGLKDAVVMNTRFDSISVSAGTIESVAVVAGLVEGNTKFKNLEFTSCAVSTDGNYASLCAARNTAEANISFENITVKMSCSVEGAKYTGVLLGDIVATTSLSFENVDMSITAENSGGQMGGVAGRVRGGKVSFKNIILRDSNITTGSNKTGLFYDGAKAAEVSFENILIINGNLKAQKQASLLDGGASAAATTTYNNIYAVNATCTLDAGAQELPESITTVEASALTEDWYRNTLKLDKDIWVWDVDTVKLVNTSPNRPSEGATISSISLVTSGAKTTYLLNEEVSTKGLVVKAKYSDGVEIALDSSKYTVDSTAVDKTKTGQYEIKVKVSDTVTASYNVNYITVESIYIDETELDNILVGEEKLDTSKVVVIGVLTDGSKQKLSGSEDCKIEASEPVNGVITVTAKYQELQAQYSVTKISAALAGDAPVVAVDAAFGGVEGTAVEGKATFKSLQNAIEFIEASGIKDKAVTINLAAGTYNEKVTISQPNIRLIGAGQDSTKITYGLAAGHKLPSLSGTWGTDGSATVTVKGSATGFYAEGIMFENSFDYLNDNSVADKQALAILCSADQAIFKNCGFFGYQDTLETKGGRQLFDTCYIAGAVDFIFGTNSTSVFKDCEIKSLKRGENQSNGGYITAAQGCNGTAGDKTVDYGFVFLNCNLTAEEGVLEGSVSLGRPWRTDAQVAYINCAMGAHIAKAEYPGAGQSRWEEMNGDSPEKARFFEYGSTGAGAVEAAVKGGKFLTADEAAKYTLANVFAAKNGAVEYEAAWDGTLQGPAVSTTIKTIYYFNGETSATGYDAAYTLAEKYEGKSGTLGDLTLDGTNGKISPRSPNNADSQVNAGSIISYTATASGTMTVTDRGGSLYCDISDGTNTVASWAKGDGKERTITIEKGKTYSITFTDKSYLATILIVTEKE